MIKEYKPIVFKPKPSRETPLSADNLNHLEQGVIDNNSTIAEHINTSGDSHTHGHVRVDGETISSNNGVISANFDGYATEEYVRNAINQAEIDGGNYEIDLSIYALKSEIPKNDYTNQEKIKLNSVQEGADKTPDLSVYALKSDLNNYLKEDDIKEATQVYINDIPINGLRKYIYDVNAIDGQWILDYSDKNFKQFVNVSFYSIANGDKLADRTIPTLRVGQPTLSSCSGYLMSASSAGLLAAMTLINASGKVRVTVEGV